MLFCPRVQRRIVLGKFYCRDNPLILFVVGLGPYVYAVDAGEGSYFSFSSSFSLSR